MIKRIKVNLEAVEAMLYFWQAVNDRENISEMYIYDIAAMPSLSLTYDDKFNEESVRKALSAIKNREIFSRSSKKEGRFYSNNLWMMEDLGYTNSMVTPLKKLNMDKLGSELSAKYSDSRYDELEVIFSPLHLTDYIIKDNKLIVNFFKVKPTENGTLIGENDMQEYLRERLEELLSK